MNRELKVFDVQIDELDETGIELISIVDRPAIESNFIKLSEEIQEVRLTSDRQKQYVTGGVLIPERHIYRRDPKTGEEYYIKFSAESIEKIRNKFFRQGNLKLSNLDHSSDDMIEAFLIESWIVENPEQDKSTSLGLNLPKGSLVATYHIPDSKTWELVSERNGFSLEGSFYNVPVEKLGATPDLLDEIIDDLEAMLNENK